MRLQEKSCLIIYKLFSAKRPLFFIYFFFFEDFLGPWKILLILLNHFPHPRSYKMSAVLWLCVCACVSVQFRAVAQLCSTLCHPIDCSTPGLPELAQTHVHGVGDAIQLSHPLSSPSPPGLNLSQHQGLFQWVSSSHQVAQVLNRWRVQYCPTICDPMRYSWPGSSILGVIQGRMVEWVAIFSSRGSSRHRDRIHVSCISWIGGGIHYHCATWEAQFSGW